MPNCAPKSYFGAFDWLALDGRSDLPTCTDEEGSTMKHSLLAHNPRVSATVRQQIKRVSSN
jgi:hypothetical protein